MIPLKIGESTVLMPIYHGDGSGGGEVDPVVAIIIIAIAGGIALAFIIWIIWFYFRG